MSGYCSANVWHHCVLDNHNPFMNPTFNPTAIQTESETEDADTCSAFVITFNCNDSTGAGGIAGDIASISAIGAHAMPVVTSVLFRDTAEILDHAAIDPDSVALQARHVLEDISVDAWKVGFLGSAENVSVVAEILSDYPEIPLVAYMPNLGWMEDEDEQQTYLDAWQELILPSTEVLVGNFKTLHNFLLPEWDLERLPSVHELAVAASEHGAQSILITGLISNARTPNHWIENVLANPDGIICSEKFEQMEGTFIGAGDTLSAALTALIASGAEIAEAGTEALTFLAQTLVAGYRPGMGNIVPDRLFWARTSDDDTDDTDSHENDVDSTHTTAEAKVKRRIH